MKRLNIFIIVCCAVCGVEAIAEPVRIDRYAITEPKPTDVELDPLSENIVIKFPASVLTVGDAFNFVLKRTGWQLPEAGNLDPAFRVMLERPLPQSHRELSLMPVRTVLATLVGHYFVPIEDPIWRLYSFDLKDKYKVIAP